MSDDLAEKEDVTPDPVDEDEADIEVEERDQSYEPREFTVEKQNEFLRYFEKHQCKRQAAREADILPSTVEYAINHSDTFSRMYENSKEYAAERIKEEMYDRAIEGQKMPVYQNGEHVGNKTIKSDRLLEKLADAYVEEIGQDEVDVNGEVKLVVEPQSD
jgi:hypothetical protein